MADTLNLYEVTIEQLLAAYSSGKLSPVAVTARFLERIAAYDRANKCLNSIVVFNEQALADAAESARRWRAGCPRPLEGVPFTVKDSYMVKGLTVASGSPAFANLTANWDAFTVAKLKAAGAVLIGKTNMPPMADGGMQRGLYGRAENPYNPNYLAAAYASGSSNGSAVATAANFAVFGMGEETVSSGRSPAANNALCAYTPSWGVLSIRGNWPLFPARDVVVPHTRTMPDMLRLLNTLVADDPHTRGDFWRHQEVIAIPAASSVRPDDYLTLADQQALAGKTFAAPKMFLGKDANYPFPLRESIATLWQQTVQRLEALGAKVVETEFPLISTYEGRNPGGEDLERLGVLPAGWMDTEFNHFLAYGWDDFLRANADPNYPSLGAADPDAIFPLAPGTLPDRYEEVPDYENRYRAVVAYARAGISDPRAREDFAAGLQALVQLRKELFEDWLRANDYAGVIFPACADIGHADSDRDQAANDHTWLNGVLFSTGNYALRHLGIPTVTVPMGATADLGVPAAITFAGSAYSDNQLLSYATALDSDGFVRPTPEYAPAASADTLACSAGVDAGAKLSITATVERAQAENLEVTVRGQVQGANSVLVTVQEQTVPATVCAGEFSVTVTVSRPNYGYNPQPGQLLVVAKTACGSAADFVLAPFS